MGKGVSMGWGRGTVVENGMGGVELWEEGRCVREKNSRRGLARGWGGSTEYALLP